MPGKKSVEEQLLDSLNRVKGQITALENMLEKLNWSNQDQVKKASILFKAIVSAIESSKDRFKEVYLQKRLEEFVKELRKV